MPDDRSPSSRDDRDEVIERQRQEIADLREEVVRVERQRRVAERERDRLKRQTERLKQLLAAARRAGFRQAAPFAKDRPQGQNGRPGRRAGAAYGRRARRRPPRHVDERHTAALPPTCPDCGGAVHATSTATQYQEDLPSVQPVVREFDVEIGTCAQCGRRVQGRHPRQASEALGAANVHLGPGAVAFVVFLHTHLGVPLAKIATVLRQRFRLTVTPGGLAQVLHRTARQARPTYEALCDQVRGSPMVSPDETGWRVGGARHWLWAFATPDTTVYAIQPGRSFADATTILHADFAGVLVRDGWAPYRQFEAAWHQTCLTHLIRRARLLATDHPRSPWPGAVAQVLQDGLTLRDRRDAQAISDHGLAVARGRLLSRLATLINDAPRGADLQRFAGHLATEFAAVFTCLWAPGIDATNWRAEHAIRPAVVTRKVCGGNRTRQGADTQQVLASVVRTVQQRQLDLTEIVTTLLRTPQPLVPAVLQRNRQ